MADEKTMSTCLRLPVITREQAIHIGDGNITEGIVKAVSMIDVMTSEPDSFFTADAIKTILSLAESLKYFAQTNKDLRARIHEKDNETADLWKIVGNYRNEIKEQAQNLHDLRQERKELTGLG